MLSNSLCRPVTCFKMSPFRPSWAPMAHRAIAAHAQSGERVIKVAHILLNEGQTDLADDIEGKLIAGTASFDDMAQQHSKCSSAKRGGELGWLSRGTFFPQFEAAAFAAPLGALARATTGRGLHIIKVLGERYQSLVQQIAAEELAEVLTNPALREDVQLVDVREEWEWQTARIPGFQLLPLSDFSSWAPNIRSVLDPKKEVVVLCHHGVRSMQMAQFLVQEGFTNVKNVTGGIDSFSRVDPSVPLY
ncbi:hypothetical protein Vretimale_8384 [Volvox reticuliferus]|uniref:Peptidyl-prolyl cis-trans isomerase n=1 Tax=Volvox reticuliferus TaxID=1737510 RepID=A0A8J4FMX4_9CHLO|nr:hypothetical protein Vretifemale_11792 [Volvox reticuliferus]GIM03718.1 hypothetical protein Vretimale_8384 [Volvox reticuliferus]